MEARAGLRQFHSVKTKRASGKRELIKPNKDSRFVRRARGGQFKESDDVGKSLRSDGRTRAKTKVKSGYGDRGDRRAKAR
jgi:hypothetical protein